MAAAASAAAAAPLGFAPDEQASLPPDIALAYAGVLKAPPQPTFDQRWTAWGAGYRRQQQHNGDPAVGSNNVTTQHLRLCGRHGLSLLARHVAGFALAGGGTNWGLANALGTGRSDAFLAGVYGVTRAGPAYLAGALAFTNYWFTTNRTALGDQLTANFHGQSYGARLEGGYRYRRAADARPDALCAPIQAQDFHTPATARPI